MSELLLSVAIGSGVSALLFFSFWWIERRSAPSKEHMDWSHLVLWGKQFGFEPRRLESYESFRRRIVGALHGKSWEDMW